MFGEPIFLTAPTSLPICHLAHSFPCRSRCGTRSCAPHAIWQGSSTLEAEWNELSTGAARDVDRAAVRREPGEPVEGSAVGERDLGAIARGHPEHVAHA